MSKRGWIRWISAAVVAALAGLALAAGWVWQNPLAFDAWNNRRSLFEEGFVQGVVAGVQGPLAYLREGDREAAADGQPTLVFLHGAGDRSASWAAVAPAFAEEYRVLIPDLAGHGRSAPHEGPLPFDVVVEGFEAFMGEVQGEYRGPAILVGNSMGAWVASVYAHRHPDRVARLVLVDGGPIRSKSDVSLMPSDREEARSLMAALRDPGSEPVPGFVLDDVVQQAAEGPIARLFEASDSMEKYLLEGRLDEIEVPVEIVWGASDRMLPPAYAERLATELPRARITWIDDCGHLPQVECPARLRETLETVLNEEPLAPAPPESETMDDLETGAPEEAPGEEA